VLVLSRKRNEAVVINGDITVTVVDIRGDKVRLGFVAPKEVGILRSELVGREPGDKREDPANAPHP
jgi:carbon storage regulator